MRQPGLLVIDFYFIRDKVIKCQLHISHILTFDELVKSITKLLICIISQLHRFKIDIINKSSISWE